MSNSNISIRVTTNNLRDILAANPEAGFALESMAAEKVAQELARKFIDKREKEIAQAVRNTVQEITLTRSSWSTIYLSDVANKILNSVVADSVRSHVCANAEEIKISIIEQITTSLETRAKSIAIKNQKREQAFFAKLETWWTEKSAMLDAAVKDMARREFVSVIQSVL